MIYTGIEYKKVSLRSIIYYIIYSIPATAGHNKAHLDVVTMAMVINLVACPCSFPAEQERRVQIIKPYLLTHILLPMYFNA